MGDGVKQRGSTFRARIDVVESMGSELYAHFTVESDQNIESQELRELAEDAGGGEVPSSGEEGRIVARFDPGARSRRARRPRSGWTQSACTCSIPRTAANLTAGSGAPAATGGGDASQGG